MVIFHSYVKLPKGTYSSYSKWKLWGCDFCNFCWNTLKGTTWQLSFLGCFFLVQKSGLVNAPTEPTKNWGYNLQQALLKLWCETNHQLSGRAIPHHKTPRRAQMPLIVGKCAVWWKSWLPLFQSIHWGPLPSRAAVGYNPWLENVALIKFKWQSSNIEYVSNLKSASKTSVSEFKVSLAKHDFSPS